LEKRGERGGVTAAKVKEGKPPPGKSRAKRPLQLLADFTMEHHCCPVKVDLAARNLL